MVFIQQDKYFLSPSLKDSDYESFILHDVDLLPENDYNTYTCSTDHPKHGPSSSKLGTYHSWIQEIHCCFSKNSVTAIFKGR